MEGRPRARLRLVVACPRRALRRRRHGPTRPSAGGILAAFANISADRQRRGRHGLGRDRAADRRRCVRPGGVGRRHRRSPRQPDPVRARRSDGVPARPATTSRPGDLPARRRARQPDLDPAGVRGAAHQPVEPAVAPNQGRRAGRLLLRRSTPMATSPTNCWPMPFGRSTPNRARSSSSVRTPRPASTPTPPASTPTLAGAKPTTGSPSPRRRIQQPTASLNAVRPPAGGIQRACGVVRTAAVATCGAPHRSVECFRAPRWACNTPHR